MSDLCLYEFEDIVWDELCQTDDHIVPYPGFERADDHSVLGDKKPHCEGTCISNSSGDRAAAGYFDQRREQGGFSSLSKRRNTMLDKDSWSHAPNAVFHSSYNRESIKEVSTLTSENTISSSHTFKSNNTGSNGNGFCENDTIPGDKTTAVDNKSFSYPLGDINHTGNNVDLYENTQDKDSSDFLYYGWPEIGNFEDVDRMFRSCDSTFGLGASNEDDMGWFSSADNIGGSEDVVKSDFKLPCPETNPVENISQNHDSSQSCSVNDSVMTSAPTRYKDSCWTSEKPDSYMSFVHQPGMTNSNDGFIPKEQMNEHKSQFKLQNQSIGKRKEQYFRNGSFSHMSNLPNEVVQLPSGATSHQVFPAVRMQQEQQALGPGSCNYLQNPISYVHSDNSPLSDLTSVNPIPSVVKSEANDLTTPLRDSFHASSQFQSMKSSHNLPFPVIAPAGSGKREKLHNRQSSRPSVSSSLKNARVTTRAAMLDPGAIGTQVQYSGDKSEDHGDNEGVCPVVPAELGSSNIQESSTMSSGMNDISLEAASFHQLQLVMEQLDMRTRICIRDSLYRLARSAEQRHNHANLNGSCGDERDASRAFIGEGTNKLMDIETDTNPIDRSIAHLLFHRPSESSAVPSHDSLPFKTPSVVRGSAPNLPVMVENLVICEETAPETEKISDR